MIKFLKLNEIAAILNESPEIIVKECEMGICPHNRTPEGEYYFKVEDVLAVRKPTPKYTTAPNPIPQDKTPRPTAKTKKPVAEKRG